MATWKKIITSGSNADLNQITASAVKFPNDSIPIASLASDAVTITAGDGLKTGGSVTLGSSVTLDVDVSDFAGTGLKDEGSENLAIDFTDSTFTTISGSWRGELSSSAMTVVGGGISGSAISTGSFGLLRVGGTSFTAAQLTDAVDNDIEFDGSTANGLLTYKDADEMSVESNLTFDGTNLLIGSTGKLYLNDAGGEHISGNGSILSIAGGTEIDLTATTIDINGNVDISGNTVIGGDLTVNGTTTTVGTTNTEVKDQFLFIASGSQGANVDGGIIIQSGSAAGSGSALYHDKSTERWAVAKSIGKTNTDATTHLQFVSTIKTSTSAPSTSDADYGVGEMWVDTDDQEIYIRTS